MLFDDFTNRMARALLVEFTYKGPFKHRGLVWGWKEPFAIQIPFKNPK